MERAGLYSISHSRKEQIYQFSVGRL